MRKYYRLTAKTPTGWWLVVGGWWFVGGGLGLVRTGTKFAETPTFRADYARSVARAANPAMFRSQECGSFCAMAKKELIRREEIERSVLRIRGQNVMLDVDLAALYQVSTGDLVRAVKRNHERFPEDFMFQLARTEFQNLRCQFGISRSWGGRRYPPYAFTEQGVAMLSSVLRSRRAAVTNVEIMRAFIRLRRVLESRGDLSRKLDALEEKYDAQFADVFEAIRELIAPPMPGRKRIGFG